MFLEISQNTRRKTHVSESIFFYKVTCLRPATLLKKRLWHRCFPVNVAKFLKTPLVAASAFYIVFLLQTESSIYFFSSILWTSNHIVCTMHRDTDLVLGSIACYISGCILEAVARSCSVKKAFLKDVVFTANFATCLQNNFSGWSWLSLLSYKLLSRYLDFHEAIIAFWIYLRWFFS